jgi:hypothetical protein
VYAPINANIKIAITIEQYKITEGTAALAVTISDGESGEFSLVMGGFNILSIRNLLY